MGEELDLKLKDLKRKEDELEAFYLDNLEEKRVLQEKFNESNETLRILEKSLHDLHLQLCEKEEINKQELLTLQESIQAKQDEILMLKHELKLNKKTFDLEAGMSQREKQQMKT